MENHQKHHHSVSKGISLAFWLNLSFSIIELVGGILTNSTAIIADAFHDFIDAVAIGMAVWMEKISGKKRSAKFSYGHRRFSLVAALGMSVFLIVGAILMGIGAFKSFFDPEPVNSIGMLWLALLGIAINGLAFLRIRHGDAHHSHGHEHGHSHHGKAIMLHLLEDVLGWVAVLVGAVVIYYTGWYWIDGVLALGIAIFIGYHTVNNLVHTMKVFLQAVPENIDMDTLYNELTEIEGIEAVHDLHVWSLDGQYHIASLHAVVPAFDADWQDKLHKRIAAVMSRYQVQHPTIQFETTLQHCKLVAC